MPRLGKSKTYTVFEAALQQPLFDSQWIIFKNCSVCQMFCFLCHGGEKLSSCYLFWRLSLMRFVNLKSNWALKSIQGHNLLKSITTLIASLVPRECKQAIISSQKDKQGIKFKEGSIQCCPSFVHDRVQHSTFLIYTGEFVYKAGALTYFFPDLKSPVFSSQCYY